jgi:hypothetical protein
VFELRKAAVAALILHLIAGACMALILRHGLETNPDLQARISFITEQRGLWTFAWLTWTAAALSILNFYHALASAHGLSRIPVFLAAAAMGPDFAAQAIEIGVIPSVTDRPDLYLLLHRISVVLSGYAGNGLYSLAALMLAWTARRIYPSWTSFAGVTVGLSGLALSAAAILDSVEGMFWTNVVLVPALLIWTGGVGSASRILD